MAFRYLKNLKNISKVISKNKIADKYVKTFFIGSFKILEVTIVLYNDEIKNKPKTILNNDFIVLKVNHHESTNHEFPNCDNTEYYDGDDFSSKERTEDCFK